MELLATAFIILTVINTGVVLNLLRRVRAIENKQYHTHHVTIAPGITSVGGG